MAENYPKITSFKTADAFRAHRKALKLDLEIDDAIPPAPESPLAQGLEYHGRRIGNRWCILPMEGVGLPAGRFALRTDPPPLAAFRRKRREAAVRLRGVRRDGVRQEQYPPAYDHPRDHAETEGALFRNAAAPRGEVRHGG
ncbi:MAG: hypothetical protein V8T86_07155 [Victivallis sp.]